MTGALYFEELAVGQSWCSRGRTITQADVVNFAGMTGDYDPLHVDHEFARSSPFGQPIAHGLLGLSLVAGLGSHYPSVQTVAFVRIRNWEFLRPVFIGDTVHAVNEIVELQANGRRRGRVTWRRKLVNQKGEVVQEGIFETLVARGTGKTLRRDASHEDVGTARVTSVRAKRSRKPTAPVTGNRESA